MTNMTNNYYEIFLNSTFASNPAGVFTLLFLFMARMLPIIAQAPFFGARILPHPVKITFAISLFVIFLPQLVQSTSSDLAFNPLSLVLFAKELFIGFLLGLFISIPFTIVQSTGIMIDHQRGGASLMVNDPTVQNQSSPLGTLFNFILIYLFYLMDGPFLFIDAILKSYEIIPPDKFINAQFFNPAAPFAGEQIKLLNTVMKISIQLATPALIAILMTDVFLGIANRLAPQVQITFLGMPLKSLIALVIIFIGWTAFNQQVVKETYAWLNYIDHILNLFKDPNL